MHAWHLRRARLLIVYDSPASTRRRWPDTVLADRVRIGPVEAEQADPKAPPAAGKAPAALVEASGEWLGAPLYTRGAALVASGRASSSREAPRAGA